MKNIIENEVSEYVGQFNIIIVESNEDLSKATFCIKGIKQMQEKVKSSFDPIVDQAHKAHKEAISQRDKYLKPLQDIEKRFKEAILLFSKKLELEQRERERIANELLAKKAEEERQRILKESEGKTDAWDKYELEEKAKSIVPITVDIQKKFVEQEGLSIRRIWKARIIDESKVPRMYLVVDLPQLNSAAKIENIRKEGIAGIEFYEESTASVR